MSEIFVFIGLTVANLLLVHVIGDLKRRVATLEARAAKGGDAP